MKRVQIEISKQANGHIYNIFCIVFRTRANVRWTKKTGAKTNVNKTIKHFYHSLFLLLLEKKVFFSSLVVCSTVLVAPPTTSQPIWMKNKTVAKQMFKVFLTWPFQKTGKTNDANTPAHTFIHHLIVF